MNIRRQLAVAAGVLLAVPTIVLASMEAFQVEAVPAVEAGLTDADVGYLEENYGEDADTDVQYGVSAIKEFHIRVSEIIRTYVEGRFDVYALEMTTPEVMAGLGACRLDGAVLAEFASFLDRCDLVKFAKVRPGVDACLGVLATARRIVDETKPRPVLIEVEAA